MATKIETEITAKNRTDRAFDKFKSNMNSSLRIAGALTGAIGGLIAAKSINDVINLGDQIQKFSLRTGSATEALSQYNFVAEQSGIRFQVLTTAWQRQTRRIAEAANGTGVAREALDKLNLSAEQLNKLKPEQQFEAIASRLAGVASEGERVRLAMQFWDTDGVKLLQIVNQGAENIAHMKRQAELLGLTLDQDTADKMAGINDAINVVGKAFEGLANFVVKEFGASIIEGFRQIGLGLGHTLVEIGNFATELRGIKFNLGFGDESDQLALYNKRIEQQVESINKLGQAVAKYGADVQVNGADISQVLELSAKRLNELSQERDRLQEKLGDNAGTSAFVDQGNKIIEVFKTAKFESLSFAEALNEVNRKSEENTKITQQMIDGFDDATRLRTDLKTALESLRTPLESLHTQIQLQHELFRSGAFDIDEYNRRLGVLNEQYQRTIENGNGVADSFANLGDSINNNIASSIGNMAVNLDSAGDAVKSLGKGIISQLITAMIKMAITGQATQAATTAASVASAATTAVAWAPAAAAVNAATFGGGAAAGSTGLTSIAALSQSLFAVPAVAETGTDRVKRTGLSLIHKDEIIGTAEQNTKLDKAIALMNKSGGGQPVNITINVNSEGVIDEEATERFVKKIERVLITTVQSVYDQRGRSAFGPVGA